MRVLLFLLSALFLLESTKGMEYEELDEHDRRIVDEAIKQANKDHGKGKHLDVYTITKRDSNMLHVILRPTSCDSTTLSVHWKECKTENKPPQVSCIDCNGTMEPCLLLRQKEEIKQRMKECPSPPSLNTKQIHYSGSASALYQKGGNHKKNGCLGCV